MVLELHPLRERPNDIPLLVSHFLEEFRPGEAEWWTIQADAAGLLESYGWPGNVRELRNVIERAVLLGRGQTIRASDLGSSLAESGPVPTVNDDPGLPSLDLDTLEGMAIEQALERTAWHQGRAAKLLGISARTLHRKIRGLGLHRPSTLIP